MTTLRSLLYLLFLGLSTIVYAVMILAITPWLSFEARSKIANRWGLANLQALRFLCRLDYQIDGLENLPQINCIIMVNHQSAWETIALRGILPPTQTWVLKRELLAIPFFGWALRAVQPVAIDRTTGTKALKQVLTEGIEALRQGRWVVIFPEGTRVALGERRKYNIGGALLAEKSGYPILPIAHNAGVFWQHGRLDKPSGTIQVVIGPLIVAMDKTANQINNEVELWINGQVEILLGDKSI